VVQMTLRVQNAHSAILIHLVVLVTPQHLPRHNRCTVYAEVHSIVITEISVLNPLSLGSSYGPTWAQHGHRVHLPPPPRQPAWRPPDCRAGYLPPPLLAVAPTSSDLPLTLVLR
jgi:hypothetical protein